MQGKLPLTFPNVDNVSLVHNAIARCGSVRCSVTRAIVQEINFTRAMYPGDFPDPKNPSQQQATYSERLLVGYRWYDANKVQPAFPFGMGLVMLHTFACT